MGTSRRRDHPHRANRLIGGIWPCACGTSCAFGFARCCHADDARQTSSTRSCAITSRARSEDDIASGMHPDEVRRAARDLAGVQQRNEECRDARGLNLVDNFAQDLRFAARQLLKSPGFTATAVLMIGLGMGASVAILGFVDAALVKPLPYRDRRATPQCHRTQRTAPARQPFVSRLPRLETAERRRSSSFDVHNGRGYMLRTPSGRSWRRAFA